MPVVVRSNPAPDKDVSRVTDASHVYCPRAVNCDACKKCLNQLCAQKCLNQLCARDSVSIHCDACKKRLNQLCTRRRVSISYVRTKMSRLFETQNCLHQLYLVRNFEYNLLLRINKKESMINIFKLKSP